MSETFSKVCTRLIFEARDQQVKAGSRITPDIVEKIISNQETVFGMKPTRAIAVDSRAKEIYLAYPLHKQPKDALRAIEKAMREVPAIELLAKTKLYAEAVSKWPRDFRYTQKGRDTVPYPASWFNSGSYMEDPKEWEVTTAKVSKEVSYVKF